MAFEDDLRKRLQGIGFGGGAAAPPAPPSLSPEAAVTMNRGTSGTNMPPPQPSASNRTPTYQVSPTPTPPAPQPAASPTMQDRLRGLGFGASPQGTVPNAPPPSGVPMTPGQPGPMDVTNQATDRAARFQVDQSPPLNMYGLPFEEQAKRLRDFLRQQGLDLGNFKVGGSFPIDDQINEVIKQINATRAGDPGRGYLANQLKQLVDQRNIEARTAPFVFDVATGRLIENKRTPDDIIGDLAPTDGSLPGYDRTVPAINPQMLQDLLARFAAGGITDEEKATQEGQLVSDVEQAAQRRRQLTADRLGAAGNFGGNAFEQLEETGRMADASRASGLSQIRLGILEKQDQARARALDAVLRQMGMGAQESQAIASLLTQRSVAQAGLAQGGQQFRDRLDADLLNINQGGNIQSRGQNMSFILALMQLENQVGEQDRALIRSLINQFLYGG